MRKAPLQVLLPLLALLAASAIAACGGSTSSTSSTSAREAPTMTTGTTPAAKAPGSKTTTKPPGGRSARGAPPSGPSRGSNAGGAKSFIKPNADNSIPNFGAESGASQRTRAEAALRAYLAARARGDWAAACTYLSSSTRSGVERFAGASKGKLKGCAPVYKALSSGVPAAARANPLSGGLAALRVKGRRAFALFYGPHAQQYVMPMARESGKWKVTQLAPLAYPPGAPAGSP